MQKTSNILGINLEDKPKCKMILSHKYKFVCLNPPKTGSGFREKILLKYSDASILTNLKVRHWNSTKASDYIKSINKDPNDYYWFTFVRNPWERIISWANMAKNQSLKKRTSKNIDIEKFVLKTLKRNNFKNYIYRDGKLLDFIGSLENITEDFNFVLNKLNINIYIGTAKAKYRKNFKDEIRRELTPELIKKIADLEKEVIEMKNYKFNEY